MWLPSTWSSLLLAAWAIGAHAAVEADTSMKSIPVSLVCPRTPIAHWLTKATSCGHTVWHRRTLTLTCQVDGGILAATRSSALISTSDWPQTFLLSQAGSSLEYPSLRRIGKWSLNSQYQARDIYMVMDLHYGLPKRGLSRDPCLDMRIDLKG